MPRMLVFFIFLATRCWTQGAAHLEDMPFFVGPAQLDNPGQRALIEAFQAVERPSVPPSSMQLEDGWGFSTGQPSEGLYVSFSNCPQLDSLINLPHRVMAPNHPLWYQKEIRIETESVLFVNADDGAQVFANGQAITNEHGCFFPAPSSTAPLAITIRVLNNAMKGGLRDVRLIPKEAYRTYLEAADTYHELQRLLQQLLRQKTLPHEAKTAFLAAARNPGRQQLEKAKAYGPGIIITPFLQRNPEGHFVITIETDSPIGPPELFWGGTRREIQNKVEGRGQENVWQFLIPREGSEADSFFFYLQQENHRTPITPVSTKLNTPFTFTAWGDSQGGWKIFRRHIDNMQKTKLAFTIGLGDLTADGVEQQQWRDFLNCLHPLASQRPVVLVPGNHDYDGYYDSLYSHNYHRYSATPNYFSWIYGNAIFLSLDPNSNFPLAIDEKQRQWMEKCLASDAWKNAGWRFLLIHQPPYSQGWPDYHGDAFIRHIIDTLAQTAGIDFVLSGHSHDFERLSKQYGKQQTHFLVLGGAGGGLEPAASSEFPQMDKVVKVHHYGYFEVYENKVLFRAIGLDGGAIDEIVFKK